MRNTINVKVDLKGFDLINPKIQKAIGTGLDKAGFQIERDAKIFSPVRTGRLRASINKFRTKLMLRVQDNVHYGIYQEFGTRKMNAHPFMKPSLIKNIPKIKSFIIQEIRKVLR